MEEQKKQTLYSLKKLISQAIDETYSSETNDSMINIRENEIRTLSHKFSLSISAIGFPPVILKKGKNYYSFTEEYVPYVKAFLKSMIKSDNIWTYIINNRDDNGIIISDKFHEYVQLLIDELDSNGDFTEEQLKDLVVFISNVYHAFPLTLIDSCHRFLDMIKPSLSSLFISQQIKIAYTLYNVIQREFARLYAENAINIEGIAELLEFGKEYLPAKEVLEYSYDDIPEELRLEYVQRDSRILASIQDNPLLRDYIEKSLGKKAEEIFGYDETATSKEK